MFISDLSWKKCELAFLYFWIIIIFLYYYIGFFFFCISALFFISYFFQIWLLLIFQLVLCVFQLTQLHLLF